jgi:predicted metalloendopeptidase
MHHRITRTFFLFMAALTMLGSGGFAIATAQTPQASPIASPEASPVAPVKSQHGIRIADLDLTVDPGDDFYQFSNGGWLARTELPAGYPTYGVFDELNDKVTAQLQNTVQGLEADATTDTGKVKIAYEQFVNPADRDAAGIDPMQPIMDRVNAIDSIESGLLYQQNTAQMDGLGLFQLYSGPSFSDATQNIGWLGGPYLSLPSQNYYLDDSDDGQHTRDLWVETTTKLLVTLGYDEAAANQAATDVLAFETEIAKAMTPDADRSDPTTYDNPRTFAEMAEILPGIDWDAWLAALGVSGIDGVTIDDIKYFNALNGILADSPATILRDFYNVQLIWSSAPYLSTTISDLAFSFNGPVLGGVTEREPLENRGIYVVQTLFPDPLAQAYVAESFSPEAKAQIEALVGNLLDAYRVRIENSTWMSDETKLKAIEKLDLINVKVGYPDTWKDYSGVAVGDVLYDTVMNTSIYQMQLDLAKIGQPVDRTEWAMDAFTVNAYYNPQLNEIVFPAAILQAPFFDPEADAASNYGAIGYVIGHEITHGFDISGAQFDGYGNISPWWTDEDYAAFNALNDKVVAQYDAIEVLPGVNVDGALTIGENVADLGGIQVAYDALMLEISQEGAVDQPWFLTQQQRFFIAASSAWRSISTDAFTKYLISVDVHAPSPVRGVQPMRNADAFYTAFDIDEGDPMYLPPEERIVIW